MICWHTKSRETTTSTTSEWRCRNTKSRETAKSTTSEWRFRHTKSLETATSSTSVWRYRHDVLTVKSRDDSHDGVEHAPDLQAGCEAVGRRVPSVQRERWQREEENTTFTTTLWIDKLKSEQEATFRGSTNWRVLKQKKVSQCWLVYVRISVHGQRSELQG